MSKRKANSMMLSFFMVLLMAVGGSSLTVMADDLSAWEYQVERNDSLYKIAGSQLDSGERWTELYELNKDTIKDPSLIYSGQILKLPGAGAEQNLSDEQELADKYAQQHYDAALEEDPYITGFLKALESDKAHLEGLEFRLKSVESTSRKILSDAHDMEISIEEASSNINDSLRYTYVIDDSDYVNASRRITDILLAGGYSVYKFKNYWANEDVTYQGINALFKSKEGLVFEVQFHTPASYKTKGEITHRYYEIIRSETATQEEKAEAKQKQDAAFAMIPIPDGVFNLSY